MLHSNIFMWLLVGFFFHKHIFRQKRKPPLSHIKITLPRNGKSTLKNVKTLQCWAQTKDLLQPYQRKMIIGSVVVLIMKFQWCTRGATTTDYDGVTIFWSCFLWPEVICSAFLAPKVLHTQQRMSGILISHLTWRIYAHIVIFRKTVFPDFQISEAKCQVSLSLCDLFFNRLDYIDLKCVHKTWFTFYQQVNKSEIFWFALGRVGFFSCCCIYSLIGFIRTYLHWWTINKLDDLTVLLQAKSF